MKRFISMLFLIVLTTGYVCAQKIKVNEVDKFTKERIIETSFEKIVTDKSFDLRLVNYMKNVWIAFRKVEDQEYLRIKWCSKTVVAIDKEAEIIFLDKDDETYTFKNTDFTIAGEGKGTVGMFGSALYGVDIYATGDLLSLKDKVITDLRIHTTDGYYDFSIDKKATEIISKTYKVFENEINKLKE